MAQTDVTTASDDFIAALKSDPQNADLQQQAFIATVMAGRPESVALATDLPSSPAAILVLGNTDVKAGNWRAAEAKFASLPTIGATQVLQPLLRAWAEQGAGATDEALNTLRPFVEGTRYRGVFALHAAMINDLAGRTADAARLYRIATVEYGALNLRLGMVIGSWQARSGQEAEARATVRATAQASPDLSIAEPAMQLAVSTPQISSAADGVAEAYLALAATLQRQDASDFSLLLLRLALDLRPDFTAARLLMAEIQTANHQPDAATATLAAVANSDPLIAVVQLRRAQYADREGHLQEAQRQLEQLADQYKQRPEPLALLANMQRSANHFSEAAETYGRAIDRISQPTAANWSLFYQRGMAYDRAHDWPHAEADLLRALELSPNQPYVLNYLGYAWTEQGRNLARARQMIEQAVEQQPNEGSIVDSLGWVLLRQGDKAGAVRFLERAVELLPEDATVNGHLGDAYMAVGRRREAEVQWRRALILNPDPQEIPGLQSKLSAATTPAAPAAASATPEHRVE
ncbi:tetratricopeptide repeat protein [Acidisphaera sp. L21]|uniref:tetratricopeptide repeat protein n=1 Tax=Acidisphaera sp. L21 TaxID=1641851 RepID=UPI00131C5679|nr:tetratricopeptide repeat protein [Acidisphaera sp. L21]